MTKQLDWTGSRLSLLKGEGRVRVRHDETARSDPLTSILSPSARGEADRSALREDVICRSSAMSVF
jgi:hypothetical protein